MPRLGSQVSLFRCTLLSSLLLVCSIHETEQNSYCQQIITERHLDHLQELADTQMQQPGTVSFRFISKMRLSDSVCYVKAAFPLLGTILNRTTFKENSTNANKMKTVRKMYENIDENVDPCIRDEDDKEHALSEMCFEEFTTSPYEMLVLVRQFFQDIKQLLQNKETFEKDCSQVYRSACAGPRQHSSSPGVGTDPDCNCLSPALPSATQPSLSAATRAGRDVAPASTRVPYRQLGGILAELGSSAPSEPPSSVEGSSGAEELPGAGLGDASAPSPTMQQTLGALLDPAASAGPKAEDVSIPSHGMPEEGAGTPALPHRLPSPRGISAAMPAAVPSSGSAQRRGVGRRPTESPERVTQLRFSRMAPPLRGRAEGGPGDGARARGWGLSRLREPEDGGAGPSFDSSFVLSAEQRRKEPPAASGGHRELLVYVTVASVVAVLLAMGGLLFYKYKSKVLQRGAALKEGGCDPEEPESRALQGAQGCAELETQEL